MEQAKKRLERRVGPSIQRIANRRVVLAAALLFAVAGCFPLVVAILLSFCRVDPSGGFSVGSLDGYRAVLESGRVREFARVLFRAATVTGVTMLVAVPAAYWLARFRRVSLQTVALALIVAPWLISDMLRAFGWQLLLSPIGAISSAWSFLTGLGALEGLRYNFGAVVCGLVSSMLPAGILSVFAAIPDRHRTEWLAAAEIGRPQNTFVLMAFSRARAGLVVGLCAVFVLSCFASAEARFLDGPTQTSVQTLAASLANDGVPALLAFSVLLVGFALTFSGLVVVASSVLSRGLAGLQAESQRLVSSGPVSLAPVHAGTGGSWSALLELGVRCGPPIAGALSIAAGCLPLLAVATEAFRIPSREGPQWTLQNFRGLASPSPLTDALFNSFGVAAMVAMIAAAGAFILSLVAWDPRMRRWVLLLLASLVLVPGDAYAICLLQILKLFGQAQGRWFLVVLAHVLWALPFVGGTLLLANQQIRLQVLEAALEYARGPFDVVIRIVGRINLARIVGGALLAGTLSLNEYSRSSYLSGGLLTISNEVHGRLTAGMLPGNRSVFAAALLIFVVSIASVAFILVLLQASRSVREQQLD